MDREKQSVITVAVQYYTELVAVKGTAPYVLIAYAFLTSLAIQMTLTVTL
jgi:hypothetical protein